MAQPSIFPLIRTPRIPAGLVFRLAQKDIARAAAQGVTQAWADSIRVKVVQLSAKVDYTGFYIRCPWSSSLCFSPDIPMTFWIEVIILASWLPFSPRGFERVTVPRMFQMCHAFLDPRFNWEQWGRVVDLMGIGSCTYSHVSLYERPVGSLFQCISHGYWQAPEGGTAGRFERGSLTYVTLSTMLPAQILALPLSPARRISLFILWVGYFGDGYRTRVDATNLRWDSICARAAQGQPRC